MKTNATGLSLGLRALALAMLLAQSMLARTIYVSFAGSDSRGDGTASNPLHSIAQAQARAAEGDVIVVRGGLYRESGLLSKAVSVQAADGAAIIGPSICPPLVVEAGPNQRVLLPRSAPNGVPVTLSGSVSGQFTPLPLSAYWCQLSWPGPVLFQPSDQLQTTARFYNEGLYTLRLVASDALTSGSDEMKVEVVWIDTPPQLQVYAGPDQSIDVPSVVTLQGQVNGRDLPNPPSQWTATWSKSIGPGPVTFGDSHSPRTTAGFSEAGTYTLRLEASDGQFRAFDDVTISVGGVPTNRPPTVNAGPDQSIPLGGVASLGATVTDDGKPNPPGLVSVTWSQRSGPGGATLANANSTRATARFTSAGTYVFRATASDSALSAWDEVTVQVEGGRAPTVEAGPDQAITLPAAATLQGQASDDGLPNPPGRLTMTWSKSGGPGTVTFGDFHALRTTASFSCPGTYTLRLGGNDGQFEAFDEVRVVVQGVPINLPPTVSAGPDQTVFAPTAVSLRGSVSDDGRPNPPGRVTCQWSKVSGPGQVTFQNAASAITQASFTEVGVYVLRLTATDDEHARQDDVQITFSGGGSCFKTVRGTVTYMINGRYGSAGQASIEAIRDQIVYGRATANSQGQYSLVGLPCGRYTMRAHYNGYYGDMEVWLHSDDPYQSVDCSILVNQRASLVIMAAALADLLSRPASLAAPSLLPDGSMALEFSGWVGTEYEVQRSSDLIHWTTWTNAVCTAPVSRVVDSEALGTPKCFYRLRMVE